MVRPYKHVYDGIMEHYMMKQCNLEILRHKYFDRRRREFRDYNEPYVPLPQSVTDHYRAVRDSDYSIFHTYSHDRPKVTTKTIRERLKKMGKRHIVEGLQRDILGTTVNFTD